jgi:hypothetical protein
VLSCNPFDGVTFTKDQRGWVAALSGKPKARVTLPVVFPSSGRWAMLIDRVEGNFAIGLWRRPEGGFTMPSNAIEKMLGVSATVRWWETYGRIAKHL